MGLVSVLLRLVIYRLLGDLPRFAVSQNGCWSADGKLSRALSLKDKQYFVVPLNP